MFKLSPSVVFQEILAVRGGAKPYYFFRRSTSRLPRDPSSQRWKYVGEKWPMNFAWNARLPRSIQESFTCSKSTTWDRRLYFPKEGVLRIFSPWKIRRFRLGLNPRTGVPKASTLPLDHRSRLKSGLISNVNFDVTVLRACKCTQKDLHFWTFLHIRTKRLS